MKEATQVDKAVLVVPLKEGRGGYGKGAKEVYHDAAWIRLY